MKDEIQKYKLGKENISSKGKLFIDYVRELGHIK